MMPKRHSTLDTLILSLVVLAIAIGVFCLALNPVLGCVILIAAFVILLGMSI
jgi:hypothetical protein